MPRRYKGKVVELTCPSCSKVFVRPFCQTHLSEKHNAQKDRRRKKRGQAGESPRISSCSRGCATKISKSLEYGKVTIEQINEIGRRQARRARIYYKSSVDTIAIVGHWFEYSMKERIALLQKIVDMESMENVRKISDSMLEMLIVKAQQHEAKDQLRAA